jgi:hypothetical protein
MKQYILPAVTAAIGFALAWVAKPDHTAPASATTATGENSSAQPARTGSGQRPASAGNRAVTEVRAGDFPLADAAAAGPKTREEAKMLRLAEALGLTVDQQGAIIRVVEDAQATASSDVPVMVDLAKRGQLVSDGLKVALTPEQLAKFQELQERERDNLIEVRAQQMLTAAIAEIDLSPQQREDALARLRQKARADLQGIPADAALLFDKSLLPVGKKELSVDGLLALAKMGEDIVYDDPAEAHRKIVENQKRELEDVLRCFDGILTPAQMGQYSAALNEQRENLNRIPPNLVRDIPPIENAEDDPEQ